MEHLFRYVFAKIINKSFIFSAVLIRNFNCFCTDSIQQICYKYIVR